MHKYLCLCGVSFKNKSDADLHEEFNEPMNQDYIRHKIFKMKWKAKLASLLWKYPWHKTLKFLGAYIIYATLMSHFDVSFNLYEACLMGLGLGLLV